MARYPQIEPERRAEAIEALRAGEPVLSVAKRTGISAYTIYGWRARIQIGHHVELQRRPVPAELRDTVLNAWQGGASLKDLAASTGRSAGTVGGIIFNARMAGDPRAALRTYQRSRPALPTPALAAPSAAGPLHKEQHPGDQA